MGRRKRGQRQRQLPVLAPGDSLLKAMSLMERARSQLLPVVCAGGMLVGLITEARVLEMWAAGPMEPVATVMTPVLPPIDEPVFPQTG